MSSAPPPSSFSKEQLIELLRLKNVKLVGDLYEVARKLAEWEDARRQNLDTKASSLLAASGLCVTILSALVGAFARLAQRPGLLVIVLAMVTLAAGSGAALFAIRALRVRSDLRRVSEHDLLRADILEQADDVDEAGPGSADAAVAVWRRYITASLVLAAQNNFAANEQKARALGRGQVALMAFILGALFLGLAFLTGVPHGNEEGKASAHAAAHRGPVVHGLAQAEAATRDRDARSARAEAHRATETLGQGPHSGTS